MIKFSICAVLVLIAFRSLADEPTTAPTTQDANHDLIQFRNDLALGRLIMLRQVVAELPKADERYDKLIKSMDAIYDRMIKEIDHERAEPSSAEHR
jgi:hypothetical protein